VVDVVLANWDAQEWYAFGTNVLAVGAIGGGLWAVYNYRKTKRAEAARWLQGLFRDFYTNAPMVAARELVEYDYEEKAEALLQLRITDRHVVLSRTERDELRQLDLFLNYLEQIIYLEEEGHLERRDVDVFFQYWFEQLRFPERATLRRYLARCGYEKCADAVNAPVTEYVAFYGSLMRQFDTQDQIGARDKLRYVGPCMIKGRIYDMGNWPSLVQEDGQVAGELYEIQDHDVFRALDRVERYDPADRVASGYLRRCVRLIDPPVDAWLYVTNEGVDANTLIDSGSWSKFVEGRNANRTDL
jgi:gamma-glutamylcyclotransferase (GGCT)/AIG2-like uncharacterized protein YtfP